jgi:hypothetical protein
MWPHTSGFPNLGGDFVDPPQYNWNQDASFDEYVIHTLYSREKASDYNATEGTTTSTSTWTSDDDEIDISSKTDDDFYWSITINFS